MGNSESNDQMNNQDIDEDENEDYLSDDVPINMEVITQTNPKYFKKKKCVRFVGLNETCTGCKQPLEEHLEQQNSSVWTSEECTICDTTDSYGKIKFPSGYRKKARYIRVSNDTNPYDMLKYLTDEQGFSMNAPKLIISVSGGAKRFSVDDKTKKAIKKGLIKAAKSTNAWIITGGTNVGVMRLVGDAVNEDLRANKLHVLGIATWGVVAFRDKLIRKVADHDLNVVDYFPEDDCVNEDSKAVSLNPNHTHFLLVDDGSTNEFGKEINFRAELEKVIQDIYKIPMILLVVEGGEGTLRSVYESLLIHIPVILIARTKGCSDLIREAKENFKSIYPTDSDLKNLIIKWNVHKSPNETHLLYLRSCLADEYDSLINIFHLKTNETDNDIEGIISRAISKTNTDLEKLVEVAIRWNRYEDAQYNLGLLLKNKDSNEFKFKINNLFKLALIENRYNFINLLLENGLNMIEFLTPKMLGDLYNHEINLYHTNASTKIQSPFILYLIKEEKVIFGNGEDAADPKAITERVESKRIKKFLRNRFGFFNAFFLPHEFDSPENDENRVQEPEMNLFLWCIFMNRIEMAKIFWRIGKNQICNALIGAKILKFLANELPELDDSLEQTALELEKLAIGVLSVFERNTRDALSDLFIVRYMDYLQKDCLELAVDSDCKNFVSNRLVQKVMDDIWYGQKSNVQLTDFEKSLKRCQLEQNKKDNNYIFKDVLYLNGKSSNKIRDMFKSVQHFFQLPYTHFLFNGLFYGFFLIIFSYLMLYDYNYKSEKEEFFINVDEYENSSGLNISNVKNIEVEISTKSTLHVSALEYLVSFWIICLFYEECRQFFRSKSTKYYTWKLKIKSYFSNNWNILDLLGCFIFFIGYTLRVISFGTNESIFNWSRIVLSIDLILWYIRSLHFCLLFPSLGPKIVMMQKMIDDLKYFMIILITFIFGFGISLQAIMSPNNEFSIQTLLEIFNMAYWPIYGELALLGTLNDDACKNGTLSDCANRSSVITSYFILMIYMIIANVLLLNILIAMFSNTFEDIQKDANLIWKNQRYDLLCEYISFPLLPPPLNIPYHLVKLVYKQLQANNCIQRAQKRNKFTHNYLIDYEQKCAQEFLSDQETEALK